MFRTITIGFGMALMALGLAIWIAPVQAAPLLHFDVGDASELTALRADVGGLFVGVGVLCLAGALMRSRTAVITGAVLIGAVAAGRSVGMLAMGGGREHFPLLLAEVCAVTVLLLYGRPLSEYRAHSAALGHRRLPAWSMAGVVVVALLTAGLDARVGMWIFERGAATATARDNSFLLGDDALRVAVCGSSAPLQSATRAKACVAVFAGGKFYLVDVGPESVENLVRWGMPLSQIGGVLLTHFHSDHIGDLGELNLQTWAGGRPAPLAVYGGPGVEGVVAGFNSAYRLDQGYRTDHHTDRIMPASSWPMTAHVVGLGNPTVAKDRVGLVLEAGGLRITAIEVDHAPISPAYAYRFDYRGRSVVVTGDLKFHPPLASAAKGADVLISEAIARSMVQALQKGTASAGRARQATILYDIQDYHLSPREAAEIAETAGVKLLVFYHLLPAPDTALARRLFADDVRDVRKGGWTIASDGSLYTLPIGSPRIDQGRIEY
jgi:ribonuclease Z